MPELSPEMMAARGAALAPVEASQVAFNDLYTQLGATNVQEAIYKLWVIVTGGQPSQPADFDFSNPTALTLGAI